ncbi:sensor histidine kinase [Cohnella hashimotonis]|uniref:Oxygen sensor histidine kinase NreB n=1 Tax=Cohnella hashimotonis TaxID=2826895 RepID=A0ABT6TJD0_9BACL|nr:ATP-binding protein [Cohnella hashimotonis]MDI4646957.1 ATP-binding protein [Cohnella hashimotonis]
MAMQSKVEPYLLFEERNRIAEELHDRICPHLFGITYAVHSAEHDWEEMTSAQHLALLRDIQEAAAEATRELRKTIYDLSVSDHGGASWLGGVESLLASQAKLSGVRIRFRPPAPDRRLSVHHQKALYRIIAEAISNAIRHGECTAIDIKLTLRPCSATLRISDNGKGFDVGGVLQREETSGFGLSNMKTLAAALGGSLQIDSDEGGGTRIVARLPLSDVREEKN